ncbi:MAG: hypothetical protein ACUVSY_06395 [Roseiflexus sp.]
MEHHDLPYLALILESIGVCARYKPKLGQGIGDGLTLEQFQTLYRADPFYHRFGLDQPMMYAAHKAAGGMTSIYRQIGIGCEKLFRTILRDSLGLSDEDVMWSYEIVLPTGKKRTMHLDGRVSLDRIADRDKQDRFRKWMKEAANKIGIDTGVFDKLHGTVFEVRQGYKSKDSKRQNADIANAAVAYTRGYLPCVAMLSTQIDNDILNRYTREKWVIMTGIVDARNPFMMSTYDFMRNVVGYDLAGFLVVGGFDLLAVNLFEFEQKWRFAFAKNSESATHEILQVSI